MSSKLNWIFTQPWKVEANNKQIKVYGHHKEDKSGIMPKDKANFYNQVDVGIFLSFLELCSKHNKIEFNKELFIEEDHELENIS